MIISEDKYFGDDMKNNKGFTLVELMAVIIIISLIALLTFPNIVNQIKKTRKFNNKTVEDIIIEQAKKYINDNLDQFEDKKYCFSIDTLLDNGYIKESLVGHSDNLDKKAIYITKNDDYKYEIMDKDKCNINLYDYVDNEGNGYNEVDYIEATGEQYIDTEYALWPNPEWKIETKIELSEQYDFNAFFGSLDKASTENEIWSNANGYYNIRFLNNRIVVSNISTNVPLTIVHDNTGSNLLSYIDGNLVNTTTKMNTHFSSTLGFGHRNGGGFLKGKIYYLKFWSNGELVRDYVPVINKDNKACLYDKIDKKCYYSDGINEYIFKKDFIKSIDGNYTIVNYLESTGTQYIDTNYALWLNPSWKIDMEIELKLNHDFNAFFGSLDKVSTENEIWSNSSGDYNIRFLSNKIFVSNISTNVPLTIVHDNTGNNLLSYINENLVNTTTKMNTHFSSTLGFGHRNGGGYLKGKIYYLKFWSNGELVRDYQPIIDNENRPCLLDKVEMKCYYNRGTGEFLWG